MRLVLETRRSNAFWIANGELNTMRAVDRPNAKASRVCVFRRVSMNEWIVFVCLCPLTVDWCDFIRRENGEKKRATFDSWTESHYNLVALLFIHCKRLEYLPKCLKCLKLKCNVHVAHLHIVIKVEWRDIRRRRRRAWRRAVSMLNAFEFRVNNGLQNGWEISLWLWYYALTEIEWFDTNRDLGCGGGGLNSYGYESYRRMR